MIQTIENKSTQKIIPLSKWNDYYDFPKVGTLRQISFKNINNFNEKVVRRIATRMYIDVEAFFIWLNDENTGSENA